MKFSYRQRKYMPLCILGRKNHSWKKGQEIFKECGICGYCGYDAFEDVHRTMPVTKEATA
jgi:hypothetical protein